MTAAVLAALSLLIVVGASHAGVRSHADFRAGQL